jgi:hypothetical protein
MQHTRWKQRALGATLALSVQAIFLLLILLSPSRPTKIASLAHETILLLSPLPAPPPSTIDARGPRTRRAIAPAQSPVPPPMPAPPSAASPLAPPSGLAGFGRSLFGCAPEQYANLTQDQRAHCPKPGEGLAKNDDRDLLTPPPSHAKMEAMWQEQWAEDRWAPAPCLPSDPVPVAVCLLGQSIAENRRRQAAWEKIAADRAAELKPRPPPVPIPFRHSQDGK